MLYAQVGQHHLARTTETSLEPRHRDALLFERAASCSRLLRRRHGPRWRACPEHCPVCILQAHGGGAIPGFALSTIERFVAVTSGPARWNYPLLKTD